MSYTVIVTGVNLTLNLSDKVICIGSNCALIHKDSRLSTNEEYNVSVVVSNIFGSAPPVYYVGKTYITYT